MAAPGGGQWSVSGYDLRKGEGLGPRAVAAVFMIGGRPSVQLRRVRHRHRHRRHRHRCAAAAAAAGHTDDRADGRAGGLSCHKERTIPAQWGTVETGIDQARRRLVTALWPLLWARQAGRAASHIQMAPPLCRRLCRLRASLSAQRLRGGILL